MNKAGYSTVYRTVKSDEDKEEVEGTVLRDGGEDVSIVPVVYPCETVRVSSLGYFLSVGSSSKPSHTPLPVSLGEIHIQEYFNNKRRKKKIH